MSQMESIREWFGNNPPDFIQFPQVDKDSYGLEEWIEVPTAVFRWTDKSLQKWLDLKFNSGFGTQQVPSFHAWNEDRVYYVVEYDGSTRLDWAPRNPDWKASNYD